LPLFIALNWIRTIESLGKDWLAEVHNRTDSLGVALRTWRCHGKPAVELINCVDEIDADLLIVGYDDHSHSAPSRIASVTNWLVQNAGRAGVVAT
jgi:nucleotide-binding universal stress UspA family protein